MRGYLWASVVFCAVLSAGLPASGALYTVPLDGLRGVYSTGDIAPRSSGPVIVELPVVFERIDAVYLDVTGNTAPTRWRDLGDGTVADEYPCLWFSMSNVIRIPGLPPSGLSVGELRMWPQEPFRLQQEFFWKWDVHDPCDWSLLAGKQGAEVDLSIQDWWLSARPREMLVPAVVGITDAKLIIDGVAVPEPGCALFLVIGCALLRRQRRQSVAVA